MLPLGSLSASGFGFGYHGLYRLRNVIALNATATRLSRLIDCPRSISKKTVVM